MCFHGNGWHHNIYCITESGALVRGVGLIVKRVAYSKEGGL